MPRPAAYAVAQDHSANLVELELLTRLHWFLLDEAEAPLFPASEDEEKAGTVGSTRWPRGCEG